MQTLFCMYVDIGRCGMSANETTLYPSHNYESIRRCGMSANETTLHQSHNNYIFN